MAQTTTILSDTPEYTITRVDDSVTGSRADSLVYKTGSAGFNVQAMQTKMNTALAALETADANWATITAAQKDNASHLAVRATAKLIRFVLGQFDAN